jgi:DNA repair protein RAD16
LYESIYGDAKRKFNTYVAADVVLNNYANIFQLITRMRQMADHPDLVLKKNRKDGEGTFVCRICDDEAQDAIRSKCHHVFCRMCVSEYIDGSLDAHPVCPVCSVVLNIDVSAPALDIIDEDAFKRGSILNRIDMTTWRSSTKIEALVEELWKLRSRDCTIKVLLPRFLTPVNCVFAVYKFPRFN